ncbi:MAG: ABC transporter permease subunit [Oscillospiraceae bacterium]|jgi:putative aldouronate transport system permease protein|nr:ABC transporter permease subunit [Oscillospiraceae bacterium]
MKQQSKREPGPSSPLIKRAWSYKYIYLMMLPGLIYFLLFHYVPMLGTGIAFREFSFKNPFFGGEFVGLKYFRKLFSSHNFSVVLRNTIIISFGRLVFEFPLAVALALLFNEVRGKRPKRFLQTVYSFPHFLSWVVAAGIITNLLSDSGVVNQLVVALGGDKVSFLTQPGLFRPLLHITNNWKEIGWGTIVYLATITSIDSQQYEAAIVDGANRWHQIRYITLPSLVPIICTMLLLQVANVMSAGFDQIFNMYNSTVYSTGDIIDTYIYRMTFVIGESFSSSIALGLFKSVINLVLLTTANWLVKRFDKDAGIF